ncbi:MAG: hypothetical protein F4046_09970 [Acidimicrobiaceae bacterium]|nr:hypothetical protein [Acidimicrobiaceae bacterium]
MTEFFTEVSEPIRYAGPDSNDPLTFRGYDTDRVVGERTMAERLRMAVRYWHSFNWPGNDLFGDGGFDRPWLDPALARWPRPAPRWRPRRPGSSDRWTPTGATIGWAGTPTSSPGSADRRWVDGGPLLRAGHSSGNGS